MDTPRDTPRILLAKALATYLLRHSLDKQGQPLINHALRVYSLCSHLTEDQQIASILHDCLEDGQLQDPTNREYWIYSIILKLFEIQVSGLVLRITRHPGIEASYEQYIEFLAEFPSVVPIKLADLTDKLDPSRPIPDSLRQRYLDAKAYLKNRLNNLSTH